MADNNTLRYVYGIVLSDLESFTCRTAIDRKFGSGDLIFCTKTATSPPEPAVLLGIGTTKEEAKTMANTYLEEVGRIHGVENIDTVLLGETQLVE